MTEQKRHGWSVSQHLELLADDTLPPRTMAVDDLLAEYLDEDDREDAWEAIKAYAEICGRAALESDPPPTGFASWKDAALDERMKRVTLQKQIANVAQGAEEPDCWAILTPNGSRLVSPDEAKGRLDAYPLYTAPTAQTALRRIAHELRTYNQAADEYKGEHIHKVWALEIEAALSKHTGEKDD